MGMEGHGSGPESDVVGETHNGFTSAGIFDFESVIGATFATVVNLSDDDLLVCILIGDGTGLELTVFVLGI